MNKSLLAALLAGLAMPAFAQQITVVNFGGANANAQKKAYYDRSRRPASRWCGRIQRRAGKIKAMSRPRRSPGTWSRSNRPTSRALRTKACSRSSTLEIGNKADFLPAAVTECGIGVFVWSTVMPTTATTKDGPATWPISSPKSSPATPHAQGCALQRRIRGSGRGVQPPMSTKVLATKEGPTGAFKKMTELKPESSGGKPARKPAAVPDRRRRGDEHGLQRPNDGAATLKART